MKMFRKLVSIVAAATLLASSLAFSFSAGAASVDEPVGSEPNLQENVQNGVILHAFNWSYNSIKENLPAIKAAGYSTVQTSPVQQPKNYVMSTDVMGQWWKLYQPVSLQIAQQSWLGTKAELTSLCTEADKYGIKIICDIVSNHMGNQIKTDANSISDEVKTYQPALYNQSYFHSYTQDTSDGSVQAVVQGHVSKCPDLNTGNSTVQNYVLSLLKECIDCGVDGFRFDAAKHIETPSDGSYASQFWPTVTNGAKSYYKQKTGKDLFIYGEILNTCGPGRSFGNYTSYIGITDNKTGDRTLAAVNNGSASGAANSSYVTGQNASKVVLWAESHDTYMGDSGSGGISNTAGVDDSVIAKAWAIVAARSGSTALYFARPGDAIMGQAGTDATYKSVPVSEVNKFKNAMVGKGEKLGSSGNIAYVARGTEGVVLVNCAKNGGAVNASVSGTGLANGTYTDTVTGNQFTVSGGTVSGNIGASGIAVVYKSTSTPTVSSSVESCSFSTDTISMQLKLENATSGTYCLDNSSPVTFTGTTAIKIGSDYRYGEDIHLTLTATDGKSTNTVNYTYKKVQSTSSGVYIWFNAARKSTWTAPFCAYVYDDTTAASQKKAYIAAAWPGIPMKYDETQKLWYAEVPTTSIVQNLATNTSEGVGNFDLSKSSNTCVIINGAKKSGGAELNQYPADGSTLKLKLGGISKEYAVSGANSWNNSTKVPTVTQIEATNVTKGYAQTTTAPIPTTAAPTTVAPTTARPTVAPTTVKPTTAPVPTTVKPTVAPTTAKPTEPVTTIIATYHLGDVNNDGVIDINDATFVQMYIALDNYQFSKIPADLQKIIADVNKDGVVDITDVTYIQMYAAELDGKYTNEPYYVYGGGGQTSDKVLSVTAKSNVFPTWTTAFNQKTLDENNNYVTVTYFMNSSEIMANTEWQFNYDPAVLQYDAEANTRKIGKKTAVNPMYFADGGYVFNPTFATGVMRGNASDATEGYLMTDEGKQIAYFSLTFKVIGKGATEVNLDVETTQLKKGESEVYIVKDSKTVDNTVDIKPVTSVYAGKFKADFVNPAQPDEPIGPEPSNDKVFSVTAKSNVFPTWTTSFTQSELDAANNLVTISYFMNSNEIMANTEWQFNYDPSMLQYDAAANTRKIGKKTAVNPMYFADGGYVFNPTFATGVMRGNASDATEGYLMTDEGKQIAYFSLTFKVIGKGATEVNLDVETTQLKKGDTEVYVVKDSKVVDNTVDIKPVTSVYDGDFDEDHTNPANPDEPVGPVVTPTEPAEQPTDPVVTPTEPVDQPTDPVVIPTEPIYTDPVYTDPVYTDPVYTDPVTTEPEIVVPEGNFYLIGYFDKVEYNGTDYPFVNGKVTVNFSQTSYAYVKDDNENYFMTDGWMGEVTAATLQNTSGLGEDADKLMFPAGQVTFYLNDNGDGTYDLIYVAGSSPDPYNPTDPIVDNNAVVLDFSAIDEADNKFAAWTWGSGNDRWVTGDANGTTVTFTGLDSNVVFARFAPDSAIDWEAGEGLWGKTEDQTTMFGGTFTISGYKPDSPVMEGSWSGGTANPDNPYNPDNPGNGTVILNASAVDTADNRFYAWTWDGNDDGTWVEAVGGTSAADITFTGLRSRVLFARFAPEGEIAWDSSAFWGQTEDLDTQYGGTYTISGYQDGTQLMNGSWSGGGSNPGQGGNVILNASAVDTADNRFYAWTWDGNDDGTWVEAVGGTSAADITFTGLRSRVLFARFAPEGEIAWGSPAFWGQTEDLDTHAGGTYTITGYQDGTQTMNGSW